MRRFAVPAVVLVLAIVVGLWFLNERFQRPAFPPVVKLEGSTYVSEESDSGLDPQCTLKPFPLEAGDPTPIGGLHVSRDFGVVPNDGGNVVDSMLGAWGGEVRAGDGEVVVGLRSIGARNEAQPDWSTIAVVTDGGCWVAYYQT